MYLAYTNPYAALLKGGNMIPTIPVGLIWGSRAWFESQFTHGTSMKLLFLKHNTFMSLAMSPHVRTWWMV